jgi:CRISPR-associated protein Cmr3
MNSYLLRPKVPLLFRTGRPFGLRAETLPFPPPSAVAGALRGILFETRPEEFGAAKLAELEQVAVAGPLLVRRALDGRRSDLLLPKPADAAYGVDCNHNILLHRLQPRALGVSDQEGMDLPDGLWPVFPAPAFDEQEKPGDGPAFWRFDTFLAWLSGANRRKPRGQYKADELAELGIDPLPIDTRAHVAIRPETLTAKAGALFETRRLDFGPRTLKADRGDDVGPRWDDCEYGLLARCGEDLPEGFFTLGGKGGLTYLEPSPHGWPECPRSLREALAGADGLRLILATPAYFAEGWRPDWLTEQHGVWRGSPPGVPDLTLVLRAAALERWEAHSGWDTLAFKRADPSLKQQGAGLPITPARRLVPAGSVYWFDIEKGRPEEAAKLWLGSICNDERARRDGFGLVLPGTWRKSP